MELTLTGASLRSDPRPSQRSTTSRNQPSSLFQADEANSGDANATDSMGHSHAHSHSHHHNHSAGCDHASHQTPANMIHHNPALDENTLTQLLLDKKHRSSILATAVKARNYEMFEKICDAVQSLESEEGVAVESELFRNAADGHTLAHWAAKRADPRFLQYLVAIPVANLTHPSLDTVGMTPLHWASTEGLIPNVSTLLNYSPSTLHFCDKAGCTPLLLAAQYGHADLCAFLIQRGAHADAVDNSGDGAFHWAAYKGSTPVVGLLCHLASGGVREEMGRVDSFGQTALHLAALRGNAEVVQYLLEEAEMGEMSNGSGRRLRLRSRAEDSPVRRLLTLPDKDGKTPLDLAKKKKKMACELVLQEWEDRLLYGNSKIQQIRKLMRSMVSLNNWKMWLGFNVNTVGGTNAGEASFQQQKVVFPMALCVSMMMLSFIMYPWKFIPLHQDQPQLQGLLWNYPFLHMFTLTSMAVMWINFFLTYKTNPGILTAYNNQTNHRNLSNLQKQTTRCQDQYESTLESYAANDYSSQKLKPQLALCHSCHITRPLRSKHCRVQRKCVLMFDHFCPFVGNTVGLYNYRYFYLFLVFLTTSEIGFLTTWIMYLNQYSQAVNKVDWETFVLGLIVSLFSLPAVGMMLYHTQLIFMNLTTNEHQNMWRYEYLRDEVGRYKNPFHQGVMMNLYHRFFPGEAAYTLSATHTEVERDHLLGV